jgi:hypothetical protein
MICGATGNPGKISPQPWGKIVLAESEDGIDCVSINQPDKRNGIGKRR